MATERFRDELVPSVPVAVAGVGRPAHRAPRSRFVPPVTTTSPIGYLNNRAPGFFPPTNVGSYGVVVTEGPPPAGFTGLNLIYRTGITCQPAGYTNISQAECLANGWEMRDSAGNVLTNSAYGGVLADPGNTAYQARWRQAADTRITELGAGGLWIDDTTPRVTDFTGGVWPAAYPTLESYKLAVLSFAQAAFSYFNPLSRKIAFNTGLSADDTGSLAAEWWPRIGPYTHYLTEEYWLNPNNVALRRVGPEWFNNWPGHRALHGVCITAGCKFLPLMGSSLAGSQAYGLGSFLLDWNGTSGALLWIDSDQYVTTTDPWSSFYAQVAVLGAPTAAAVETSAGVWQRSFQNGTLTVNANTATATITGV